MVGTARPSSRQASCMHAAMGTVESDRVPSQSNTMASNLRSGIEGSSIFFPEKHRTDPLQIRRKGGAQIQFAALNRVAQTELGGVQKHALQAAPADSLVQSEIP